MQLFLPYVYVPSAQATYVVFVTPLGELRVEKEAAWQAAAAIVVLLVTLVIYKRCLAPNNNKSNKSKNAANKASAKNASKKSRRSAKQPTLQTQSNSNAQQHESADDASSSDDSDGTGRSALDESILRKGENSYYYAHQRRVVADDSDDASSSNALKKTMVSTYGWVDNKATVSIYLRDDAVVNMQPEQLRLNWTKTSFALDLLAAPDGDQAKSLVIPVLFDHIKHVAWSTKKSQLTLTLTKEKRAPWKSLNGAAKNLEEHIEYDASLFE